MDPGFIPGTAVVPSTKVELSVSCRNLTDNDVFSKSDPMCVLKIIDPKSRQTHEIGRTETIKDNLNPDFVKKFIVDYFFEERQIIKFEVYDIDSTSSRLQDHDFLGRMECSLGELVSAPGSRFERRLEGPSARRGSIMVRCEEVSTCKDEVIIQMKGTHLDKKDFFGKSDPFLMFYRVNEDTSYTLVHKTEVVKNTLNPTWQPFCMSVRLLCNGDNNRTVKVECYDWDSDGGHDFIGEFSTNLGELRDSGACARSFELINPKKQAKKKSYKNSGEIQILSCKIQPQYSFLDFVKGGMQMNFTVAIDFTASNGNPNQSSSLHYLNPYQPNQYAAAIQAVGEIVQDYDSDKLFPVLGFGARIDGSGSASHEFAVNFNPSNPYCQGVGGILQAYHAALPRLQLYGPTNFSPVINHVRRFAQQSRDGSNYFVLLIITDGVITDMPQTMDAIVEASSMPMSIIIIGVGDAEFDAMDVLDADDCQLRSPVTGKVAERDIVQFVPFRDFIGGRYGADMGVSKVYLAKEVLAEIPEQVVGYMKRRGLIPKPAPPTTAPAPSMAPPPGYSAATAMPGHPPPPRTVTEI
ncbi:copine-8 [Aplysia californica]|uniref:Copine-8 n=1 Tax=Aplysia californica TaxID=6500 RepID=A0ABM1A1G1_APLCA|nr:copine-8 [Aplysia californica]